MANTFKCLVYADRTIKLPISQPVMKGEKGISNLTFQIPKRMYGLPVSTWVWWFVYVNAKGNEYTIPLVLNDDPDDPNNYTITSVGVDFGITLGSGWINFSLEATNTDGTGVILNRWRSKIYRFHIDDTLEGNQIEYAETESDIISALIQQIQEKYNSLVGGATPEPVDLVSKMTDQKKVYLYTGSETGYTSGNWYYYNGTAWVSGGVYGAGVTDAIPTQGSSNAVQSGGVYSALIDTKNGLPEIRTPNETEADLYLSDANGNVLMELADGHIRTKNFDSSDIDTETDTTLTEEGKPADAKAVGEKFSAVEESIPDVSGFASVKSPEEVEADLYIGDSDGNVLAKLASGAIETKKFKGFQYITYKSASVTYSTLPLTLTVNHKFKKGDRVVLHVDRGAMPWDYGAYVNYYEDDRPILVGKRIDSAWIEHVITEDTDSIVATYTGQPSTAGMTVGDVHTLEVSLLGDIPIQPKVVTVKQDGTGDYTTLRGALDAIGTKANDVLNPYRIEIYAGTYDVMDDYTDEEISAVVYDQTHFVGPKLLNGMYLVGIGAPNEVVLNGDLDTTQFSSTIRGDISTLNCQGSCGFENLTVIANHLRYCVHDDFHTTIGKKPKRIVKDCIFRGYDISYNPGTTYGAGTSDSGCDYEFENCDFGENAGVHTLPTIAQKSFVHLVNCKGHGFRIGDQETSDPVDGYSIYQFDNCDFLWINHNMSDDVPHVIIRGCGGSSPIIQGSNLLLYDTGDVVAMRNGGFSQTCNVGEVTEWFSNAGHGPRFRKATSVNGASGIVVYKDANDTYIQTKGYVCTDRTTLTTFALGDYIGIANSLPVVVSDASDAIGRIAYIDNSGNGYIKLNFGG